MRKNDETLKDEELPIAREHFGLAKEDWEKSEKTKLLAVVASSVVHDIRNSLGVISSTAQFVLNEHNLSEKERQAWEMVNRNVQSIKKILKSYLELARQAENVKENFSLNEIVKRVCCFIGDHLRKQSIQLETYLRTNLPLITIDVPFIESAILNISLNALESMQNGGKLIFRTMSDEENKRITLEIEDTGCGIQSEDLGKIFSPFFTTKKTGTGMGLYSAKTAVEQNGGNISCQSQVGQGTKMTFTFSVGSVSSVNSEENNSNF